MVEDLVLKEELTDTMIDAGARLLRKLDDLGVPIDAAFWYFDLEKTAWRLRIFSPEVARKGPLDLYLTINRLIKELGGKASSVLSFMVSLRIDADLLAALAALTRTGPGIHRIRHTRTAANGRYIEDVLIYRIL
jgi:hypothetical protein